MTNQNHTEPIGWRVPAEIDVFESRPQYDPADPFQVSGQMARIGWDHLDDPDQLRAALGPYLTQKGKMKSGDHRGEIVHRRDELAADIRRLLAKLDAIDQQWIPPLEMALQETIAAISDPGRAYQFQRDFRAFFTRVRDVGAGGQHITRYAIFDYPELPERARGDIERATAYFSQQRPPLWDKLETAVREYQIYQIAINRARRGIRIIPTKPRGRPEKIEGLRDKIKRYYQENQTELLQRSENQLGHVVDTKLAENILAGLDDHEPGLGDRIRENYDNAVDTVRKLLPE